MQKLCFQRVMLQHHHHNNSTESVLVCVWLIIRSTNFKSARSCGGFLKCGSGARHVVVSEKPGFTGLEVLSMIFMTNWALCKGYAMSLNIWGIWKWNLKASFAPKKYTLRKTSTRGRLGREDNSKILRERRIILIDGKTLRIPCDAGLCLFLRRVEGFVVV